MRIFVAGGTGVVGRRAIPALDPSVRDGCPAVVATMDTSTIVSKEQPEALAP